MTSSLLITEALHPHTCKNMSHKQHMLLKEQTVGSKTPATAIKMKKSIHRQTNSTENTSLYKLVFIFLSTVMDSFTCKLIVTLTFKL